MPDEPGIIREQSGVWNIYRLLQTTLIAKLEGTPSACRDVPQRPRRFRNLFLSAGSPDVVDQVFVATIDGLAAVCGLQKGIAMQENRSCMGQALFNVNVKIAIDYGAIIVVPDISL